MSGSYFNLVEVDCGEVDSLDLLESIWQTEFGA